jgi:NTP pyrophosphatase (non-canonical NTP hydrolase)
MALPEPVDIGSLGRIIQALQDNLKRSARQGADEQTALDSQFIGVGEEAGEALGAYRRWRGFARRAGSASDVYDELADVLIVTMVAIVHFNEVAGGWSHAASSFDGPIEAALARKLDKIFSRGWVNKEAAVPADNTDRATATGLWTVESDGSWTPPPGAMKDYTPNYNLEPDGVYLKNERDGGWRYLGHKDEVDYSALTPPYTVVLGRNLTVFP